MGLGTSFGFMFLGMSAAKLPEEERPKFMVNALGLSRMGHIGLTLLVISGLFLMDGRWGMLPGNTLLLTKLILVLVLGALIGIMTSAGKKAQKGDFSQLQKIGKLGRIALPVGLAILILAVLVFK